MRIFLDNLVITYTRVLNIDHLTGEYISEDPHPILTIMGITVTHLHKVSLDENLKGLYGLINYCVISHNTSFIASSCKNVYKTNW